MARPSNDSHWLKKITLHPNYNQITSDARGLSDSTKTIFMPYVHTVVYERRCKMQGTKKAMRYLCCHLNSILAPYQHGNNNNDRNNSIIISIITSFDDGLPRQTKDGVEKVMMTLLRRKGGNSNNKE